jgi:4a-hydroxytetrahydrobiopterin dehydratase
MMDLLRRAYVSFNAKDVDALLAVMVDDVDWPNVAESTRLVGREAVRAYWEAQFAVADPQVEPTGFRNEGDAVVVSIHQTIRDLGGTVLREGDVEHVYRFRDGKVARMEVRTPAPDDWRVLLDRLQATFVAPNIEAAAAFVALITSTAVAEIDLRPPGLVHVRVRSHETGPARAISAIASAAGLTSEPQDASVVEIGIDTMDIAAIRPFWLAAMDYVEHSPHDIHDPRRIGPAIWFQQLDEPRPQRNRIHLDVIVPHDAAEARVAAALAAGGTLVSDERAKAWWVLADAEGNEVCICTWQDRVKA